MGPSLDKSLFVNLLVRSPSPGHACCRVKKIDGSCKIANGKVWRTQLLWMSEVCLENCRGNENCGRYVWSSVDKSSGIEFVGGIDNS